MFDVGTLQRTLNADTYCIAYNGDGDILFEGYYNDIPSEYYDYDVVDLWVDESNNLCFHAE